MTGCTWMAQRLPHTAHGDCVGHLPELAKGLQNLMDHQASTPGTGLRTMLDRLRYDGSRPCRGCSTPVPYLRQMTYATNTGAIQPLCSSCYDRLASGEPVELGPEMPLLWEGDQA